MHFYILLTLLSLFKSIALKEYPEKCAHNVCAKNSVWEKEGRKIPGSIRRCSFTHRHSDCDCGHEKVLLNKIKFVCEVVDAKTDACLCYRNMSPSFSILWKRPCQEQSLSFNDHFCTTTSAEHTHIWCTKHHMD